MADRCNDLVTLEFDEDCTESNQVVPLSPDLYDENMTLDIVLCEESEQNNRNSPLKLPASWMQENSQVNSPAHVQLRASSPVATLTSGLDFMSPVQTSPVEFKTPETKMTQKRIMKKRTPRTLSRLMKRHRENERNRHHGLNYAIVQLSRMMPGHIENQRETKVVIMQRVINFVTYLENLLISLAKDVHIDPKSFDLFLLPFVQEQQEECGEDLHPVINQAKGFLDKIQVEDFAHLDINLLLEFQAQQSKAALKLSRHLKVASELEEYCNYEDYSSAPQYLYPTSQDLYSQGSSFCSTGHDSGVHLSPAVDLTVGRSQSAPVYTSMAECDGGLMSNLDVSPLLDDQYFNTKKFKPNSPVQAPRFEHFSSNHSRSLSPKRLFSNESQTVREQNLQCHSLVTSTHIGTKRKERSPVVYNNNLNHSVTQSAFSVVTPRPRYNCMDKDQGKMVSRLPFNWRFHHKTPNDKPKARKKKTGGKRANNYGNRENESEKQDAAPRIDLRKTSWMNGFMMFSRLNRKKYISSRPGVPTSYISKLMGQAWRNMNPEEQKPYKEKAKLYAQYMLDAYKLPEDMKEKTNEKFETITKQEQE